MSKIRRIGLSWEPPDGWPLDTLLSGPARVRAIRELSTADRVAFRAWDLALRTGVSPQGCEKVLLAFERAELVHRCVADPGSARHFALDQEHPLVPALRGLFADDRRTVASAWPDRLRG